MGTAALLLLTALTIQYSAAAEDNTASDCSVLVTGPEQEWTPSKSLRKVRSVANSAKLQFTSQPPERSEVTFGVRSAATGLQVRLYRELQPGGYLLTVDTDGWRVHRTLPGTADSLVDSGDLPPGSVLTPDDWTSYFVSVSSNGHSFSLHRLHDNGTRAVWLEVRDDAPLPVDTMTARTVSCAGRGVDNEAWSFWTFDSLYQKAGLCHVRPSSVARPFEARPSLHALDGPRSSVALETDGSGSLQLQLFGTSHRFYLVTLTTDELTLSRAELGVPDRQLARLCRLTPAGPAVSSASVKLSLLSFTRAERHSQSGRTSTCLGSAGEGLETEETAEDGSGEEEGSAEQVWEGSTKPEMADDGSGLGEEEGSAEQFEELEGSAKQEAYTDEPGTEGLLTVSESTKAVEAEDMTDMHVLTVMKHPAVPMLGDTPEEPEAATHMVTAMGRDTAMQEPDKKTAISWQDWPVLYSINQDTAGNELAVWTSDCSSSSEGEEEVVSSAEGTISPLLPGDSPNGEPAGDDKLSRSSGVPVFQSDSASGANASDDPSSSMWPMRSVVVTAVLSAVCLALLITALVLTGLLLGRRRKQASFSPEQADLFGELPGDGLELAGSLNHESDGQQSVMNQKVNTFRPVRRQATAVSAAVPKVSLEELSLPPPPAGTRESSLDLPLPPDPLEEPQVTREGTPPLPPLPADQRTSALPPQPDELLPPLVTPGVVLQPLQDPLPPPQGAAWGQSAGLRQLRAVSTPVDQLRPRPADQLLTAGGRGVSLLPQPPHDM